MSIHWFNPLMWVSYVLLCRDIELACDEKVIRSLDRRQRADYSEALLVCSLHRRPISPCPLAFGEVGVKERVKSILRYRKPGFWVLLLSLVVCLVLSLCFLTNPKEEEALPVETLPQATLETPVRTETQPTEIATTAPTEMTYEADAAARGVLTSPPEEPYLAVYRVDPVYGELTEYISLTEDLVATILSQPMETLPEGHGFEATLYTDSERYYYADFRGVPQLVLDLAIAQCNYTFATPEDIGTIVKAQLDCPWLETSIFADEKDLPQLEEILKNAAYGYISACGYGAYLHLTMADGNTLTLVKGTDGCDSIAFGSWGGYFLGDPENTQFWHIFGLDETEHLPLN